jgi:hypothetical protein
MKHRSIVSGGLFVLALLALVTTTRASGLLVTSCGQSVPDGMRATLATDLVCDNSASAVFVGERAVLRLDGHTITGGGVFCTGGSCKVLGPGSITGVHSPIGVAAALFVGGVEGKLVASNLTLNGNDFGISSNAARTVLRDIVANGNARHGIWLFGDGRATNVTATGGTASAPRTARSG